ncbi:MAG TPA: tetratricopeptide repeat protein [Terriglobales bacterium]|nr:tetratricopeptide repeat protein [Terriglobales bacterium]
MASTQNSSNQWTSTQAYLLAIICLVAGVAIGYLVRGSASPETPAQPAQAAVPAGDTGAMPQPGMGGMQQPTPDQMKRMADAQAKPLIEQLQSNPKDSQLLYKIGNIYYDTQQYPEAVKYYEQAAQLNPKGLDVRTDLATAYFYAGDADKSLAEFNSVLKQDPNFANALFNQGMILWQAKNDMNGAVASWKKLLQTNPNYQNKDQVQQLIAKAEEHMNMKPGMKTDKPATIR